MSVAAKRIGIQAAAANNEKSETGSVANPDSKMPAGGSSGGGDYITANKQQRPDSIKYQTSIKATGSGQTQQQRDPKAITATMASSSSTSTFAVTSPTTVANKPNGSNNDAADNKNSDDNEEKITNGGIYGDFLVLTFVGILLFAFCAFGAISIYLIEQTDDPVLFISQNQNVTAKSGGRETVISLSDYFGANAVDQETLNRLLEILLTDAAGIAKERWQLTGINSTHAKLVVKPPPPDYEFDMYGSFFFAFDVITTIGFGQRYPASDGGKLFTTLITLIGCPLIVLFCDLLAEKMKITGIRIGRGICRTSSSRQQYYSSSSSNVEETNNSSHPRLLQTQSSRLLEQMQEVQELRQTKRAQTCRQTFSIVMLEILGLTIFILVPAMAFCIQEPGWTYLDSVYFSVNALSTTGFGDYLAGENKASPVLGFYRGMYVLWLLVGMAWWNAYNDAAAIRLRRLVDAVLKPLATCLHKRELSAKGSSVVAYPPTAADKITLKINDRQSLIGLALQETNIDDEPANNRVPRRQGSSAQMASAPAVTKSSTNKSAEVKSSLSSNTPTTTSVPR